MTDKVLPQDEWIERCLNRMLVLDEAASRDELRPIVVDLSNRIRWRESLPETAADLLFGPITPDVPWPKTEFGSEG